MMKARRNLVFLDTVFAPRASRPYPQPGDNARDAMEGFGKLTIEVGNAYIDDACARRHDDVAPRQCVVLSQYRQRDGDGVLALRYD
ncbi:MULTISPECIES: ATP-binding protein [unclassified Rhizobium]|uniref:hypothetical protein n=1 Tax=unclassified Rhizobium TaxID=2613769 RepID=UPI001ADCF3E0|nr:MULTISPECIES: hypothetical protein [unclassified Rhizobium]MBO9100832.1 hypothetical protein [Rhizobium sp. L58/93]MBO9170460.1 hypothetical protein [Rhizobium sp. L245/93]MBO9186385.1 hypothetical protein [Rhizobium sp. E27B/91]QXZ86294.1 hypothetical protein J5287_24875 [Rhizobium sp. K1/93]QXZ92251.1 hypothetical protein J5280_24310 [Rhizobium sp. K15/93]